MMTRESLVKLIELSSAPAGEAVNELEIYPITFSKASKSLIHGRPVTADETEELAELVNALDLSSGEESDESYVQALRKNTKTRRRRAYDRAKHGQNTMRTTGTDVELLARAVSSLPNIKVIRTVEDADEEHRPLGIRQFHRDTGIWPYIYTTDESRMIRPHTILVILGAMRRSHCHLRRLHFKGTPCYLYLAKTSTSRRILRTSTPAKTFANSDLPQLALMGLEHFIFESSDTMDPDAYRTSERPLQWIMTLVSHLSHLKKLTLKGMSFIIDEDLGLDIAAGQFLPAIVTLELLECLLSLQSLQYLHQAVSPALESTLR